MSELIHHRILEHASRTPNAEALLHGSRSLSYAELAQQIEAMACVLLELKIGRGERIAIFLEKRVENVVALFGAAAAGAVFVPVNPLLRPEQLAYILSDCNVKILVTSAARLESIDGVLDSCPDLKTIIIVDEAAMGEIQNKAVVLSLPAALAAHSLHVAHRVIDADMAAILYTSGSTGKPKGVVLSHRNLVAGAASVTGYLANTPDDRILCALPLSFDYGLSQLTTAFHVGATAVLINHVGTRDIIDCIVAERITCLAAVPPLWNQLARSTWPNTTSLRTITNSGGAMQRQTLDLLRIALPDAKVFLMYGLTEAFRSTYLPPEEIDRRPDSIGRAIPNAEVMVMRADGSPCAIDEPGELVHRGVLVSLGYWNDPLKTAERFRPLTTTSRGLPLAEIAVWSGDTVRMDADGYLYFVGRRDDMMKVSGYRISPTEIEEVLCSHPGVVEAVVFGVVKPDGSDEVFAIAVQKENIEVSAELLQASCRKKLPLYMVPSRIAIQTGPLSRNPNGKYDRTILRQNLLAQIAAELVDHADGVQQVNHE